MHTAVQGPNAAGEIMAALGRLDRDPDVDVVVIARGGGSVEDLLPFSDEGLLRAVFAMTTPVVSAIGHEPDSPLLDLVADRRAATPTDAAKTVVPDVAEELDRVAHARDRLRAAMTGWLGREQQRLDALRARPCLDDPTSVLLDRDRRGARAARPGASHALGTASTTPTTTSATSSPGSAGCPRWPPSSAATRSCRTPTATWSRPCEQAPVDAALQVRVHDGRLGVVVRETTPEPPRIEETRR